MARKRIDTTIDEENLKYIQDEIRRFKFRNLGHAIDYCIHLTRQMHGQKRTKKPEKVSTD